MYTMNYLVNDSYFEKKSPKILNVCQIKYPFQICYFLQYPKENLSLQRKLMESSCLDSKDGLPCWLSWYRICLQCRRPRFNASAGNSPWRREWLPTSVFLPGEFHGQRSLVGQSCKELDITE